MYRISCDQEDGECEGRDVVGQRDRQYLLWCFWYPQYDEYPEANFHEDFPNAAGIMLSQCCGGGHAR
jgi:hypothetical protein